MGKITLNKNNPTPLYWQIKTIIEEEIKAGKYECGDVVATEDSIIDLFLVSRIVAIKTLDTLEAEGYVKRQRGKGTVLISKRKVEQALGMFLLPATGHLYSDFSQNIISRLSSEKWHTIIHDYNAAGFENKIPSIFALNPSFIITEAYNPFHFEMFDNFSFKGKIIFVLTYEKEEKIPGSYILSDHKYGTHLKIEHAMEAGYDNILHLVHEALPNRLTIRNSLAVADELIEERKFRGRYEVVEWEVDKHAENTERIRKCLLKLGKNTCVVCPQDYLGVFVYRAIDSLNWNIPDEVGVIGYYNTPWSWSLNPMLTTVCVKEIEIANNVVSAINEGRDRNVLIQPELIKGESTRKGGGEKL